MWDARYAAEEFAYGTDPNTFLVEHAADLQGPVLSLAEGEGRNAVYLAGLGLTVHGVDGSATGLAKARKLAKARGVEIHTEVADLADFDPEAGAYGAVISIWAHLPSAVRRRLYPRVARCLRPGGLLLMEAYSEDQLGRDTGGPQDLDLLMSCAKLEGAFPGCDTLLCRQVERDVREGRYHTGVASVVQFVARKKVG